MKVAPRKEEVLPMNSIIEAANRRPVIANGISPCAKAVGSEFEKLSV
jgi:hypothetical protein